MSRRLSTIAFACAVVVLGVSPGANGEVRPSKGQRPSVQVVATRRGPWTPVGALTDDVLNPTGDLVGDGFPGTADGDDLTVAWASPATETVQVARWQRSSWLRLGA